MPNVIGEILMRESITKAEPGPTEVSCHNVVQCHIKKTGVTQETLVTHRCHSG